MLMMMMCVTYKSEYGLFIIFCFFLSLFNGTSSRSQCWYLMSDLIFVLLQKSDWIFQFKGVLRWWSIKVFLNCLQIAQFFCVLILLIYNAANCEILHQICKQNTKGFSWAISTLFRDLACKRLNFFLVFGCFEGYLPAIGH